MAAVEAAAATTSSRASPWRDSIEVEVEDKGVEESAVAIVSASTGIE